MELMGFFLSFFGFCMGKTRDRPAFGKGVLSDEYRKGRDTICCLLLTAFNRRVAFFFKPVLPFHTRAPRFHFTPNEAPSKHSSKGAAAQLAVLSFRSVVVQSSIPTLTSPSYSPTCPPQPSCSAPPSPPFPPTTPAPPPRLPPPPPKPARPPRPRPPACPRSRPALASARPRNRRGAGTAGRALPWLAAGRRERRTQRARRRG